MLNVEYVRSLNCNYERILLDRILRLRRGAFAAYFISAAVR